MWHCLMPSDRKSVLPMALTRGPGLSVALIAMACLALVGIFVSSFVPSSATTRAGYAICVTCAIFAAKWAWPERAAIAHLAMTFRSFRNRYVRSIFYGFLAYMVGWPLFVWSCPW